jgi:SAM-dependent methyltransferase
MANQEIAEYYDVTADRDVRTDLQHAIQLVGEPKIAIDCGCGAGRDIAYLLANGFIVHAYDIESESILRCGERFGDNDSVFLSQNSFTSFSYPAASLIVADASLFFCPESDFNEVWNKVKTSLMPAGIFVGSFLGPKDSMAGPDYRRDAFWPDVLVFTEDQLRPRFNEFETVRWTEHDMDGKTAQGAPHHWHVYSIVARKAPTKK